MSNSIINLLEARQFVAILLGLMSTVLVGVFVKYLLAEARMFGWRNVRQYRVNQAAIAMLTYFFFMIIVRFWSAALFEAVQQGGDLLVLENTYPVAFIAAMGSLIGGLCIIRVFTKSPYTWFVMLIGMVGLTIILQAV